MKIRGRFVAIGLSIVLALWISLQLVVPGASPVSWLLVKLFHPGPRYFQLAMDLEVEGQPVNIVRVVECKPKFARSNRWGGLGYSVGWYPSRYLVSERLQDGSGIMVIVPRACSLDAPPSPDFIPLILWTQDASNPQVLEAYFDHERVLAGGLRVKLLRFELVQNAGPSAPPTEDFADVLNVFSEDPSPTGPRTQFIALAAFRFPSGPLPEELGSISLDSQSLNVLPLPVNRPGKEISELIAEAIGRFSGAYYLDLPPDLAERQRQLNAQLRELYAFRSVADQQLEFTDTPTGVVYFVRTDLSWCSPANPTRLRCITAVDGEAATISDGRSRHYLLRKDQLFVQFEMLLTVIERQ